MRSSLLPAALLLQGCSVTRVAYDNADVFLRWQANHYFDFQGEQSDELDRGLAAFLAWHRAKALPQYARLADEAAARMQRGIKREDLDWSYDAVRAQVREALGAAAGEAAGLLDRLSPGADQPSRAAAGRRQPQVREGAGAGHHGRAPQAAREAQPSSGSRSGSAR